jgi:small nuclear ribonucleoprotein (snRNP)-like protein
MGKRIERIFAEAIKENLPKLIDLKLTVILKSDLALRGNLISYTDSEINLKVKANRNHPILIDSIQELQIDKLTDW